MAKTATYLPPSISPERAESMNKSIDAISAKEAKSESGNSPRPANWKPYKKASEISEKEIAAEVLAKTSNSNGFLKRAAWAKLLKDIRKERINSLKSAR